MRINERLIVRAMALMAAALLALFAFAACGDGDDDGNGDGNGGGDSTPAATAPADGESPTDAPEDQSSGGPGDPCALVTKEEAAVALGEPVSDARTDLGGCTYEAAADAGSFVSVVLTDLGGEEATQAQFDVGRGVSSAPEDLSFGDDSFWDPDFGTVHIRSGGSILTIGIVLRDGPSDTAKDAAIDLAEIAVERIP